MDTIITGIEFRLAGEGPEGESLRSACSCVLVHASITPEPFGLVIIEAMASGKPVVASNIGGGPLEIVDDHVCGFLVGPRNHEDVSAVLYKLLCNPYLCPSFGLAGRQRVVSRYESSLQAGKIAHIYDNLLKIR